MKVTPLLFMSDASTVFGLGGVALPVDRATQGQLMAVRHNAYESLQAAEPHEQPRQRTLQWHPLVLDVDIRCFRTIINIPRLRQDHINAEELQAVIAVIRWALRERSVVESRVIVALDSLVALHAIARGRSSSFRLRPHLRKIAALVASAGIRIHPLYTPSEWNVSDFPSRGQPLPTSPLDRLLRRRQRADDHLRGWASDSSSGSV